MLRHQGFTLIELIIVIIVMAALGTGVFINWTGTTMTLDGQLQTLANDIRYAQSLSMSKGERYRLVKTSSTTYQITNSSGTPIAIIPGSNSATLATGITFGTFTNLPNDLIAFDGKGTPYIDTGSPGTALAATATIPLVTSSETRTLSITPQTGRVTTS